jgi:hypothetical protein
MTALCDCAGGTDVLHLFGYNNTNEICQYKLNDNLSTLEEFYTHRAIRLSHV